MNKLTRPPNKIGKISKATTRIYTLRISLLENEPEIWRVVEVEDISLAKLHRIIQYAMGWHDCHLHQFNTEIGPFSDPTFDLNADSGFDEQLFVGDSRRIRLSDLLQAAGDTIGYEYDFGDSWEHRIEAIDIAEKPSPEIRYPRCVDGARACPPEDVGGIPGYEEFLSIIKDSTHPEHQEYLEWSRHPRFGDFDPERCDLEMANLLMRS